MKLKDSGYGRQAFMEKTRKLNKKKDRLVPYEEITNLMSLGNHQPRSPILAPKLEKKPEKTPLV